MTHSLITTNYEINKLWTQSPVAHHSRGGDACNGDGRNHDRNKRCGRNPRYRTEGIKCAIYRTDNACQLRSDGTYSLCRV